MNKPSTYCAMCPAFALRITSASWRCPRCGLLHVPGWDDSRSTSQDPDEDTGLAVAWAVVAACAVVALAILLWRGGGS